MVVVSAGEAVGCADIISNRRPNLGGVLDKAEYIHAD